MKITALIITIMSVLYAEDNPPVLGNVGTVMHIVTNDKVRDDELNKKLHFCIIDNGEDDLIYAGTKYGMWSRGEFDVSLKGTVVKTIRIQHLVYNGVVFRVGNLVKEQPNGNFDWHITRVTGEFK